MMLLMASLAGALLTFAFAPFEWLLINIISPAILAFIWLQQKKHHTLSGFLFGLGFFGSGASWLFVSIHTYGNTPVWLAIIITFIFVALLASLFALQGFIFSRTDSLPTLIRAILIFPLLWMTQEYVRSTLLTGFPWLLLAYSCTQHFFITLAPHCNDTTIAGLLTYGSGALAGFYFLNRRSQIALITITCFIFSVILIVSNQKPTPPKKFAPLKITLIQSNIPQAEKFRPESFLDIMDIQQEMTDEHQDSDLIIWPESAIPAPDRDIQPFLETLNAQQALINQPLITGLITTDAKDHYYNGLRVFGPNTGEYRKYHLVPFGEYVPFDRYLRNIIRFLDIPMSDLTAGEQYQPLLKIKNIKIAPLICYEIAYTDQLKKYLPEANIILVLSNDAWFGHSLAPSQHLQIARWRAMQAQRHLLFASNDGITAVIGPNGNILKNLPAYERKSLTLTIGG